jgi:type VI secretion system protein ImpL
MSFRSLLGILVFYILLVWGWAALDPGPSMARRGLQWTVFGLATVLALLILGQLVAWLRLWRSRRAVRQPVAAPQAKTAPVHPDDAALAALWNEAAAVLAASPVYGSTGQRLSLAQLPMYLLIGPQAAGKTTAMSNSGTGPQLLAGQANGADGVVPTRVANFWLAQKALYVEIAGRIYEGDDERWRAFLKGFLDVPPPDKRRLFSRSVEPHSSRPHLRGVVLFTDVRDFAGSGEPSRSGRYTKMAFDRLNAISAVFGGYLPFYAVLAKADEVLYFKNFFAHLQEAETRQPFGFTFPVQTSGAAWSADAEQRRVTKAFNAICYRLTDRRILHLWREKDPARKQAVYEFPREFRRIRGPVVQFLTDISKQSPLKAGPILRGFYFTGVRDVDPGSMPHPGWATTGISIAGPEATMVLQPDATRILTGETSRTGPPSRVVRQGIFVRELLETIVTRDRPPLPAAPAPKAPPAKPYRRVLVASATAAALLLCFAWMGSWLGNRRLLREVKSALQPTLSMTADPREPVPLTTLQSLETLRQRLEALEGPRPLHLNWGLYTGNSIREEVRRHYFARLGAVLLVRLNGWLVQSLERAPKTAKPDDVYGQLATHLAITSAPCEVKPDEVAAVLKGAARSSQAVAEGPSERLAGQQVEYYAAALPGGNPARLTEDPAARKAAQGHLANVWGIDPLYRRIVDEANQKVAVKERLTDKVGDYRRILSGPDEVPAAFTREGSEFVQRAASQATLKLAGDPCVLGLQGDVEREIRRRYVRDYTTQWKQFLDRSVLPYRSLEDAAQKLRLLSEYKSPILGLMSFTAGNTYFPPQQTESALRQKVEKVKESIFKKADETQQKLERAAAPQEPDDSLPRITAAFRPVQSVVPAGETKWVNEKNKLYLDTLAELSLALVNISRSAGAVPDPAANQQALQVHDKALEAVRQLAIGFQAADSQEVDALVVRILQDPIRKAERFISENPVKAAAGKLDGELAGLCAQAKGVLQKYPFNPSATAEASLEELGSLFAPSSGAIWKYRQQSLGPLLEKQGARWVQKPDAHVKLSAALLAFLERAQALSDAFYPVGATQPSLRYAIRPQADMSLEQRSVEFDFDGRKVSFSKESRIQKELVWPAPPGTQRGAVVRIVGSGGIFPFATMPGLWGAFRVFAGAEPRGFGVKQVEWPRYVSGAGAYPIPIDPPVRMEFARFPGDIDLFNPRFFQGLRCPARATE